MKVRIKSNIKSPIFGKKVLFAILGLVVLSGVIFLNIQKEINSKKEVQADPNIKKVMEYDQEIAAIPEDDLYYYSSDKKIKLERKQDKYGVYLKTQASDDQNRMKVSSELLLQFKTNTNQEDIKKFIEQEGLTIIENKDVVADYYHFKTSPTSRFNNALQESNYLYENFKNILEWVSPNFLRIGKFF